MSGHKRKLINKRFFFILPVFFLLMLLINGLSSSAIAGSVNAPVSNSNNVIVNIQNFKYIPQTVTINVGQTITWINHDKIIHAVGSKNGLVKCGALTFGQSYSQTFNKPGVYNYFCPMHPWMLGQIIVRG
jgi:plastocyanin